MKELSDKTGNAVSKQTISKYESGQAMAGSDILGKLATALNVNMEYFFRPFSFDISEIKISFRKKTSVHAKEEVSLKSKIQDKIERFLELEKILSIDSVQDKTESFPSITSYAQMTTLAARIRKSWGMGLAPIDNVRELLMRHGIKVFDVDGPDGFDGVSGIVNETAWVIVLNENINHVERKRLTCLHEYAHLLTDRHFDSSLTQKEKENLCNDFASEMLMPSQVLKDMFDTKPKISFQELISLQCMYGISIDAIMYSLKRLSIISDKRYRSYWIRKNTDPYFKHNIEYSRFKEKELEKGRAASQTYVNMVYSALAQGLITPACAAEFLDCTISDINLKAISI